MPFGGVPHRSTIVVGPPLGPGLMPGGVGLPPGGFVMPALIGVGLPPGGLVPGSGFLARLGLSFFLTLLSLRNCGFCLNFCGETVLSFCGWLNFWRTCG